MDHGEWPLPDTSLSLSDLYLIRTIEWSFKSGHSVNLWHYFKVWILGQNHLISNICQFLTIFKFFSKDSFWLKFDERKSSVLYTTFIGWFNGVNLFRRLSCNHNVFQYQGIFLHLNTLYCKYLFLNFKSYFILPISFTLNLLLWKLVCIEGKFQLSVSRYTNDLIFKETI